MSANRDFTEGSVGKKLLLFSLPIMAGMFLQTAYNIIDTIFIGMLGPLELAAVSLTFPVVFIFIAFASGLGIGANALISQAVGKKDWKAANNLAEHALFLGTILGVVIAVLGIVFSPVLFTAMGADAQTLPLTIQYSTPIFFGLIFMFAWFISESILRAQGDSKTPMKTLAVSVVLNIILDPLLIFGIGPFPAMGLEGAAIATVISRIVAAVLNFYYIYSPHSKIDLALRHFRPQLGCVKEMIAIGLPASASQTLSAAGFGFLTAIVGGFGSYAIAGFGIGMRLNSVAIMPTIGVTTAAISFVGQNMGAGQVERAKRVPFRAMRITFIISLVIVSLLMAFPEPILRIFTSNPEVLEIGAGYLTIAPLAFLLYSTYFPFVGAFQGNGKTMLAFGTNAVHWVLAVVLGFILANYTGLGLTGVWVGLVCAAGIEVVLAYAVFRSGIWLKPNKKKRTEGLC